MKACAGPGNGSAAGCESERASRRRDAEKLLNLHGKVIQIARVRRIVQQFCDVLEDKARLEALDQLLRRLGLQSPR